MAVKYQEIEEALSGLLREGEQLVVSQVDGQIHVRELHDEDDQVESPLKESDAELYGYLTAVNDRIANATGCLFPLVLTGAAILACGMIAIFRPELAYWWVYVLIGLLAFVIYMLGNEWREQVVYWNSRRELFERLIARNLNRDKLLTLISGDSTLASLASRLKSDRSADHF